MKLSAVDQVLQNGHMTTKKQLGNAQNEIEDRINLLTTALNKYMATFRIGVQATDPDIVQLKEILIMNCQYERFINELSGSLANVKLDIDKLLKCYREKLNEIHEAVKYRIAIPTEKIFVSKCVWYIIRIRYENVRYKWQ